MTCERCGAREKHMGFTNVDCPWCSVPHPTALRLIAALRASRAEIEQLEAELERLRDPDGYETEVAGRHVGYSIYPK